MAIVTSFRSKTESLSRRQDGELIAKGPGLERLAGSAALLLLFEGELGCSLWDWQRVNRGGFFLAALYSFTFLAFFWISLLVAAERFSRLVAWLERKANPLTGLAGKTLAAVLVSLVWNIVVVSLVMRYALGCYLNLSLLRFACVNMSHGLLEHMVGSQRWMLVALLIFLLVPEAATQRHLEILSEIAEMLSDRELRERLKTEPDAAAVHQLISDWEPLKSVA